MIGIDGALVALALFALITGIGTAAIGAGGIFIIIALYVFTALSASTIAGTTSTTSIATALLVTHYAINTEGLLGDAERALLLILSIAGALGAIAGAVLNTTLADATFGVLLGGFTVLSGLLLLYRQLRGIESATRVDPTTHRGQLVFAIFGFCIGAVGSLFGIGGPVIMTPVLVLLGMPLMAAVAIAQVQSIFLSATAAMTYLTYGAVSLPLVLLLGIPQLVGVAAGWKLAQFITPRWLKLILGVLLIAVGPFLAL